MKARPESRNHLEERVVKRVALVLGAVLLAFAGPAQARETTEGTAATVKKEQKPKKLNLYGLNLTFTLQSMNGLNSEWEGAEWALFYKFKLDWRFGHLYFHKKALAGLKMTAGFTFSHELVGTDPRYRDTSFPSANYAGNQSQYLPIQGQGGYLPESDTTKTQYQVSGAYRRVDYSDITLSVTNDSWYVIPKAKINIDGGLTLTLPTSLQSRNKGLRTYLMTSLGMSRFFKLPYTINLGLGYNFYWVHYFWKYDTPSINDNYDSWTADNAGVSGQDDLDYPSTRFNPHDAVSNGLWVNVSFLKKFSFFMGYEYLWMAPYQSDKYCEMDLGNGLTTNVCENTYDVRGYGKAEAWQLRDYQIFSMLLSYKILPYLKATAGFMTQAPERKPDSSTYQQAFLNLNYNRYSVFAFYLTFYTDKLLNQFLGGRTEARAGTKEYETE